MSRALLTVAWRLADTVRHAIGKFASHVVVVLVVEHVADVEDHCLIAEVFPPV
jgi:TRAP-type mannitol/chloroaromatic compound transport system permease small subunit